MPQLSFLLSLSQSRTFLSVRVQIIGYSVDNRMYFAYYY